MKTLEEVLIRRGVLHKLSYALNTTQFLLEDRKDTVKKIWAGEPLDLIITKSKLKGKVEYHSVVVQYHHGELSVKTTFNRILPDQGLRVSFDNFLKGEVKND